MATLPQIRKNIKFFTNGKNKPLVQLSTMVSDAEEVLGVYVMPEGSEHNTSLKVRRDLYPRLPTDSLEVSFDARYHERNIVYDRIDLTIAFAIEFSRNETGFFVIDGDVKYEHPLTVEKVIEVINNKYGYDTTTDDITVTYTSGINYTITAKPNSLQYFGQVAVAVGSEEDIPPPVKVPSHDAIWNNASVDRTLPFKVNGNEVNYKDLAAMYTAGVAFVQFDQPDMSWVIWTGDLPGEASFHSATLKPEISTANVNQTLTIKDKELYAKFVPFTPVKDIPAFSNPVTAEKYEQTLYFTVPYTPTLDKMVSVWVDNVETSISNLIKTAGVAGLRLTIGQDGYATFKHDGANKVRLQMRVNIATLPALVRSNSRFIYGIQISGNNVPLDSLGHELYNIEFPKNIEVVPDPSTITAVIPSKPEDFVAALDKVGSGLQLTYDAYRESKPSLAGIGGNRTRLSAVVESEVNEPRFPAFYFIKEKDWTHLQTLPLATELGSYTLGTTPPFSFGLTVSTLMGITVPVDGGRLFCMINDIPISATADFALDFDPDGNLYKQTSSLFQYEIAYSRASLIAPASMDYSILRKFAEAEMTPEAIENMIGRQSDVQRYINQVSTQWQINYEFSPYNPPAVLEESLDDNGQYVLQLMVIPAQAMGEIREIAAKTPTSVIIKLTDTGGLNDTSITAEEIVLTSIANDETGEAYLLFKHAKSRSSSNVRWTFRCDYDGEELTYRESTTVVNINDSVLDRPGVPFAGLSIQECSSKENYEAFEAKVVVDYPGEYYTWDEHKLVINASSSAGDFTRYGVDNPIKATVGRLILLSDQRQWLASGDFDQFEEKDPVIVRVTNKTTAQTYDLRMSYLRPHAAQSNIIPIPFPLFDEENRTNTWSFEFKWFGFGNPSRPAPSPLPNLEDGTVNIAVKCISEDYKNFDSLFNFTSNISSANLITLRNNLIANGAIIPAVDKIVTNYQVNRQTDVTTPKPGYGRNTESITIDPTKQTPKFDLMRVIEIDPALLNMMLGGTFTPEQMSSVIFKRTTEGVTGTTEITLAQIRVLALSTTSQGFIPVLAKLDEIEEYQDPRLPSQQWEADFSVLDAGADRYHPRVLELSSSIYTNTKKKPVINLYGLVDHTYPEDLDLLTLAKTQWASLKFSNIEDLNLKSNNQFGLWNVTFVNKGSYGFEVLEFSDDALEVLDTALKMGNKSNVVSLNVQSIDGYNVTNNFTIETLLEKLDGGRFLTVPIKAAIYRGGYDIKINFSFTVTNTTTNFSTVSINNVTTVKDDTPPDLTVDARWTVPDDQTELNSWCGSVGLSGLPMSEYGMAVEQFHYTHTVIVEQSDKEYVAAIAIDKEIRLRLIENRYPKDTIVGLWNGDNILAGDLTEGIRDARGDSIILVRAPINLKGNNFPLSFSVSGIEDYSQIFTGIDVPVNVASDVLVTEIQNDLIQVVNNLRDTLNPIADTIILPSDVTDKVISETPTNITNTLNKLGRENIGKNWVIPIGVNKKQLSLVTPGSWTIIRLSNGMELSVNSTELLQKEAEGWFYTKGGERYIIYPILTKVEDKTDVVKQTFSLSAGMAIGRWEPWFTNFTRSVNLEYSIKQAGVTFVQTYIPYGQGDTLKASGSFLPFMDVRNFVDISDESTPTETAGINAYATTKDVNLAVPIFVRWSKSQVEDLPDTEQVLGTVNTVVEKAVQGSGLEEVSNTTAEFTKADIISGYSDGTYYYKLVGRTYETAIDERQTITAEFDFDGGGAQWISTRSVCTATVRQVYAVACTGQQDYAGVLNLADLDSGVESKVVFVDFEGRKVESINPNTEQIINTLKQSYGFDVTVLERWSVE